MQGFVLGVVSSQLFVPPAPHGYIAGGPLATTVDKFRYDNDVRSTLLVGLSSGRSGSAGFASTDAGYVAGGSASAGLVGTVDRFAFADDSRSTLATGLAQARNNVAGFASSSAGYAAGGSTGPATVVNTVEKFTFADDLGTTLATGLASNRFGAAGFASSVAGYAAGGFLNSGGTSSAWVDAQVASKFAFADDSRTTMLWSLIARRPGAAFSSAVAGYVAGGLTNVFWDRVDKVLFADDTNSALASGLSSARALCGAFASDVAGYVAGGTIAVNVDTVDKFDLSDDTRTTLATGLSSARGGVAGFGAPP
jgi:hypothetical protein